MSDSTGLDLEKIAEEALPDKPSPAPIETGEQFLWRNDDGAAVYFDYDDKNDEVKIRKTLDVEPLLEENKRKFNEGWVNKKSEFIKIGSYTAGAAYLYGQMRGMGDDWVNIFKRGHEEELSGMVHEPDLRGFRTVPGDFKSQFKRRR